MRIDKFLKNSRIIKRRTIAKEACQQGRIIVNGNKVKPGYEVKVGDVIEVRFENESLKIRAVNLLEHVNKNAESMYEVVE